LRRGGCETGEDFLAALIREQKFPTEAVGVAIKCRRSRRSDFEAVAVTPNEGAAADVALDEALGFQFSVSVCNGGAVNTEDLGEFPARGNAVARTKVTGVNEGAELVAQLDVERDMTFGLKV
jgi:hypothetical protein